jgi:hypothetical protein
MVLMSSCVKAPSTGAKALTLLLAVTAIVFFGGVVLMTMYVIAKHPQAGCHAKVW